MPSTRHSSLHYSRGFTLIEVLIISPIVLLTIAAFIGIIITLTGEVLVARDSNSTAFNTQSALSMIEQDVRLSGAFLAKNNITLQSPQGYNNVTQNFLNTSTATGDMLVLSTIALSNSTSVADREPVVLKDEPYACSNTEYLQQNKVMIVNVVYFVKDQTLWRRTILPNNYSSIGCSTPSQQPSCHPDQTATLCKARDVRVLDGVTGFSLQYLTSAASTSPVASASNSATPSEDRQSSLNSTNTAAISITVKKSIAGREYSYSGSVRATRIGALLEE